MWTSLYFNFKLTNTINSCHYNIHSSYYKYFTTAIFNKGVKLQIKEFKVITLLGYIQMYLGRVLDKNSLIYL